MPSDHFLAAQELVRKVHTGEKLPVKPNGEVDDGTHEYPWDPQAAVGDRTTAATYWNDRPKDWDYLLQLAVRLERYQQGVLVAKQERAERGPSPPKPRPGSVLSKQELKDKLSGIMGPYGYTAKGDWLDHNFVTDHLHPVPNDEGKQLWAFRFGDFKLFKKFCYQGQERTRILQKFIYALITHPKADDIVEISMTRALVPNEFLQVWASTLLQEEGTLSLKELIAKSDQEREAANESRRQSRSRSTVKPSSSSSSNKSRTRSKSASRRGKSKSSPIDSPKLQQLQQELDSPQKSSRDKKEKKKKRIAVGQVDGEIDLKELETMLQGKKQKSKKSSSKGTKEDILQASFRNMLEKDQGDDKTKDDNDDAKSRKSTKSSKSKKSSSKKKKSSKKKQAKDESNSKAANEDDDDDDENPSDPDENEGDLVQSPKSTKSRSSFKSSASSKKKSSRKGATDDDDDESTHFGEEGDQDVSYNDSSKLLSEVSLPSENEEDIDDKDKDDDDDKEENDDNDGSNSKSRKSSSKSKKSKKKKSSKSSKKKSSSSSSMGKEENDDDLDNEDDDDEENDDDEIGDEKDQGEDNENTSANDEETKDQTSVGSNGEKSLQQSPPDIDTAKDDGDNEENKDQPGSGSTGEKSVKAASSIAEKADAPNDDTGEGSSSSEPKEPPVIITHDYLPNLQVLNLETNRISADGIVALSRIIANDKVWRFLQVLKLEGQKVGLKNTIEETLGEAVRCSPSLVVVSLHMQYWLPRNQIHNTCVSNLDHIRQARIRHNAKTGHVNRDRKRNEMELYFDRLASNELATKQRPRDHNGICEDGDNDPNSDALTTVDLGIRNAKFMSLLATEKIRAAQAFATNTHVKTLRLIQLKLNDEFCIALGKSLETNRTLEKIVLDSNDISGVGIKAIFEGLSCNESVSELSMGNQSKTLTSEEEEALPPLLENNTTLTRLGMDPFKNPLVQSALDRKCFRNLQAQKARNKLLNPSPTKSYKARVRTSKMRLSGVLAKRRSLLGDDEKNIEKSGSTDDDDEEEEHGTNKPRTKSSYKSSISPIKETALNKVPSPTDDLYILESKSGSTDTADDTGNEASVSTEKATSKAVGKKNAEKKKGPRKDADSDEESESETAAIIKALRPPLEFSETEDGDNTEDIKEVKGLIRAVEEKPMETKGDEDDSEDEDEDEQTDSEAPTEVGDADGSSAGGEEEFSETEAATENGEQDIEGTMEPSDGEISHKASKKKAGSSEVSKAEDSKKEDDDATASINTSEAGSPHENDEGNGTKPVTEVHYNGGEQNTEEMSAVGESEAISNEQQQRVGSIDADSVQEESFSVSNTVERILTQPSKDETSVRDDSSIDEAKAFHQPDTIGEDEPVRELISDDDDDKNASYSLFEEETKRAYTERGSGGSSHLRLSSSLRIRQEENAALKKDVAVLQDTVGDLRKEIEELRKEQQQAAEEEERRRLELEKEDAERREQEQQRQAVAERNEKEQLEQERIAEEEAKGQRERDERRKQVEMEEAQREREREAEMERLKQRLLVKKEEKRKDRERAAAESEKRRLKVKREQDEEKRRRKAEQEKEEAKRLLQVEREEEAARRLARAEERQLLQKKSAARVSTSSSNNSSDSSSSSDNDSGFNSSPRGKVSVDQPQSRRGRSTSERIAISNPALLLQKQKPKPKRQLSMPAINSEGLSPEQKQYLSQRQAERAERMEKVRARLAAKEKEASMKEDAKSTLDMSDAARRDRIYSFYNKIGQCPRDQLRDRISNEPESNMILKGASPDDVDLLPWNPSGMIVDATKMMKLKLGRK
eukprot:CAMPEP_0172454644 /NCGR_PEP_ID=MMETSP1065-20121228/11568_1 /TAXON_ID=265537 /ORGANISM="Amphiprora paludosa, Strain CCMP125" /LENGTH=1800 /DNA_ID=CAMNT_0013207001 /DNA_START=205 /DNA_END=5607 /DNA_ORIENTATION=+